jgi:hypothetical protein
MRTADSARELRKGRPLGPTRLARDGGLEHTVDLVEVFRLRNPIRSSGGHEADNLVQILHILVSLVLAIVVLTTGILKLLGLADQDVETAIPVRLLA